MININDGFKQLLQPLTKEELDALEISILTNGIQYPIITWNNTIIDGHNRHQIATKHKLPFTTQSIEFDNINQANCWILNNQLARRNIDQITRLKIQYDIKQLDPSYSTTKCVDESGESKGAYERYRAVRESNWQPLIEAVEQKDIGLSAAYELIKSKDTQLLNQLKEKTAKEDKIVLSSALKTIRKERAQETKQKRKEIGQALAKEGKDFKLITSSIKDLTFAIKANSIDCIVTDPPYPKEYLHTFEDLAIQAKRILKPGGLCVVMSGQSWLPEVYAALAKHLTYHWTACYLMPGDSNSVHDRHVNTFWKPILIFSNGKNTSLDWFGDLLNSKKNEKEYHHWGQSISGMIDIIERFTGPGETILDPFLGGGTTAIAALSNGRKFIGSDIDQGCIDITANRIDQMEVK